MSFFGSERCRQQLLQRALLANAVAIMATLRPCYYFSHQLLVDATLPLHTFSALVVQNDPTLASLVDSHLRPGAKRARLALQCFNTGGDRKGPFVVLLAYIARQHCRSSSKFDWLVGTLRVPTSQSNFEELRQCCRAILANRTMNGP